ncbi:MAG: feruloyl-CoA synthase [Hyphomicrobiales bacterium]|nr:feruloyl-CoA synthase [Hyphomicrobiales bacterium]
MATSIKERQPAAAAPFRSVRLGPRDVVMDRRSDSTILLRSPHPLGPYPIRLTERLEHWAAVAPGRTFLAQRTTAGDWRRLSYGEALTQVRRIGAALLHRNLSRERPIVVLSGNDIEQALIGLAALYVGIPYAPVSPAYALVSRDFGKLKYIIDLLTPGLVLATDGEPFARAIAATVPADVEVVCQRRPPPGRPVTDFDSLLAPRPTEAAEAAHLAVGPDTIAKLLFTSGSTGFPKAVINTQRMLCSNQAMILSQLAYFEDEPPVIVDWAPWHHTAGGNRNFNFVLYNGGTLYIDDGKPLAGLIETTVANLREVATNWYFTVPKGYEALLPYFRSDEALRRTFFSKLKVLWFAGAALSQSVFDEMQELALATCGERIMFLTGLGATETSPMAVGRTWQSRDSTNVGVPVPGVELKLVPNSGKLEARVRGPNVLPGYWRQEALTANAFDDEGFYKLGDALRFEDPNDPREGLLFDGRIAEDFKLATGTWVNVGPLRARLLARLEPLARDVVIAGADRDDIGALIFPDIEACRRLAVGAEADVTRDAAVLAAVRTRLAAFAQTSTGSSNRVCRAMLLAEPPSLDAGEMTDKGSINQRAVLERRLDLVMELYAAPASPRVVVIDA